MNILLLGATGRTGLQVMHQALARGHSIVALVRSPGKISQTSPSLKIVKGNPLDADEIANALPGCEAVVSALGGQTPGARTLLGDCAKSTVAVMQREHVRRIVVVSSALLFPNVGLLGSFLRRFVLSNAMADAREMERVIKASDLDWTIVRPVRLTNGPRTGHYNAEPDRFVRGRGSVSRSDVAHCILGLIEGNHNLRTVVSVSQR